MEGTNRFLTRAETIEAISSLAAAGTPFQFLIGFEGEGNLVTTPDESRAMGFHMDMSGRTDSPVPRGPDRELRLVPFPPGRNTYRKAFDKVQEHIRYGNTFLLNLTFPTRIEINYSLEEIYRHSSARFKMLLADRLVVFSPERFVRIRGNTISSNPMKGTMDASLPGAFGKLMTDPKEDAEHHTIVDLIRNDLSMVAEKVRVKRFKYVEKLRTHRGELLQMSSEITGLLPEGFRNSLGELLFTLLPAGSICGAPKKKTLEIIREVEGYHRGFYTGIFGYFDGESMDSAVAIRYIEKQDTQLVFKSGGGITFQSDCDREYDELIRKVYVPVY